MNELTEAVVRAVIIGIGATALSDCWALLLKHGFDAPAPNWALVGRWFAHMRHGRLIHDSIAAAPAVRGERTIGWLVHYAVGVIYSGTLLAIWGLAWTRQPTLEPALIIGVFTLVAPFFIMQPAMGAGIAASKTSDPPVARLRTVFNHLVFGLGLYVTAVLIA